VSEDITRLLQAAAAGDRDSLSQVAAWAYDELERLAAGRLRRRFGGEAITLEPAALVNETFLRLLRNPIGFENRRHFLAFASQVMLNALADYGRRRRTRKRGGDLVRVTLSGVDPAGSSEGVEIQAFHQALQRLEELDRRKAEVVKLRVLWGAESDEIARYLEVSRPTVERDWRFARAWLAESLGLQP